MVDHSKKPETLAAQEASGVPEIVEFTETSDASEIVSEPDVLSGDLENERDPIEEANRLLEMAEMTHSLEWRWAAFELYVISPSIPEITPPVVIRPEPLEGGSGIEFVYPIHDYGFKLSTSKAEEMLTAGMSMCKLYYTIEKMIFMLVDRLKAGGIAKETEVQVAFAGFTLAQRKAFESIINLSYNVVVTNFEPGEWGEQYLQVIKRLADKGHGYPPEAPRDVFRHEAKSSGMRKGS